MLKTAAALAGATVVTGIGSKMFAQDDVQGQGFYSGGTPWADLLGWKVGCQAYSFRIFTAEEAIKKNAAMGLRYIELFPGQTLSEKSDAKIGPDMNKEERYLLKSILAEHGVTPMSIGVIGANRAVFDFAADMGIENVNSEPEFKDLQELDAIAQEYKINLVLHNHPKPSKYWDYNVVLEQIKDLSPWVGTCTDTGHYVRSGIDPLEAVKALKGRIKTFHFKDLNEKDRRGHDVVWGTGVCQIAEILKELKEQKFRGPFFAEYEHNWENSLPEIAASMDFFNQQAQKLAKEG